MGQPLAVTVAENGIGIAPLPIFNSRYTAVPVTQTIKPEFFLLLTIARVVLPVGGQSLLQDLLAQPLDWEYLLAMAAQHGLEPLLFHHLNDNAAGVAPQKVMQNLRMNCKAIALRNLVLSAKLREISAYLTSLQIEHIAYKGPLLAEVYGSDGLLRAYRDLDFLVPQVRLGAVRDALREIGFDDKYGLTEAQQAASFRSGFEHSFTSRAGIDLDVHWHVVQEFKSRALDMDGVWARRTVARLLDRDVPALSREDLLVVLCIHAGHHGWMQLSHMCDLAQLFRIDGEFDWEIVCCHLGDSNTRRMVCISLHLLQKHWNIDIPEEIAALICADPHVERLAHRIEVEIWPAEKPALTTSSLRWLLDRSAGEDLRDRVWLLAGSIFIPSIEDFAFFRLPPALSHFYAGLRILRLAGKVMSSQRQKWLRREALQRMAWRF
jgi:hypothetical protein